MDPYVISLPKALRYLIVQLVLRTRPEKTAQSYASIWTEDGGPLRAGTLEVATKLRETTNLPIAVGMRYGEPSFYEARELLSDCEELLLLSPYPHYAESTTRSLSEHVQNVFPGKRLLVTPPYYNNSEFIASQVQQIQAYTPPDTDHLLFSFHGIPLQHIRKADTSRSHCLRREDCCETPSNAHATCYRYQCFETARTIGATCDLPWSMSFQSRLGRATWLQPYTIEHVQDLARRGVRNLAIICPSFVVDNLETLYEIDIEVRDAFLDAKGTTLTLIPCLNSNERWINQLADWCVTDAAEFEDFSVQHSGVI